MLKFYHMESVFAKMMTRLVRFLDPRFEKYRPPKKEKPYVPTSEDDLYEVIKRTPKNIFGDKARARFEGAMAFDDLKVKDLMLSKRKMKFLNCDDELNPVYVDKLYKSGVKCFPVLDNTNQICGLFRIDRFDLADVVDDSILAHHVDKNILYAREDYTLDRMLRAFLRSGNNYCIVIDKNMSICGFLTLERLIFALCGEELSLNDFSADSDPAAVIRRK